MNDYTRYALFTDGSLFAWSSNQYGLLGSGGDVINSVKPVYITENIKEIFAGDSVTYAVTNDNSLYAWGDTSFIVDITEYYGLLCKDGLNYEPQKILFNK